MFLTIAALAAASAQGLPATPMPAAAEPNKKVCKTVTITGSRLGGKRTCKTRAQWDAEAKFVQDDASQLVDKPGYGPSSN